MEIKCLTVGPIETNCYIVTNENTRECVIVDPGDESNTILNYIEERNLTCRAIFITHGHFDHMMALEEVRDATRAPVYLNERDHVLIGDMRAQGRPDEELLRRFSDLKSYDEGDTITAAGLTFTVLATPGHSPGGVTLVCGDTLFTGDTLFRGSCGRTDLYGGDMNVLLSSLKKICALPGDYDVCPGHMESSTLERERAFNFYCRRAATL